MIRVTVELVSADPRANRVLSVTTLSNEGNAQYDLLLVLRRLLAFLTKLRKAGE